MAKFVMKAKLSKKARKELDKTKRVTWAFDPVTRQSKNLKIYDRKRARRFETNDTPSSLLFCPTPLYNVFALMWLGETTNNPGYGQLFAVKPAPS